MPRSQITNASVHAAANQLRGALGLEVVHVSINPNRIVDSENRSIIPSFLCGTTKREFYDRLKAAYNAVEFFKEFGPKMYS